MTKEEYINQYRQVLKLRNLRPNTQQTYLDLIQVFLSWCERADVFPPDITKQQKLDFFCTIKSPSTFRQMRGTIGNFYEYVIGIPYILVGIPFAKKVKILPEYLTVHEIDQVFKATKNHKQRIILKMMYNLGLRVHEVVKVKWNDWCFTGNEYDLKVIGKGGKHDLIPAQIELIDEIKIFLGDNFGQKEFMFKGQFRDCYSERSVQLIFHRSMDYCKINKEGSTHLFRHSIGTHMAQNGFNAFQIQKFLRHESIKTSLTYVHLAKTDLRKPLQEMRMQIANTLQKQLQ